MTHELQPDDVALGEELNTIIGRLNRWASRHADTRLPLSHARLLGLIEAQQPAHISDLARADNCSQPGMTMQIKRLENDNLAARQADPDDARAALISLTDHGRTLLDETRLARARRIAPVIAALDTDNRAGLINALHTLAYLLDAAADEPGAARPEEE